MKKSELRNIIRESIKELMNEGKLAWAGKDLYGGCVCVYAMADGSYDHTTNYNNCECDKSVSTANGGCCASTNSAGGTLVGANPIGMAPHSKKQMSEQNNEQGDYILEEGEELIEGRDFVREPETGQRKHKCWECVGYCMSLGMQTGPRTAGCWSWWKCTRNCGERFPDPNY